MSNPSAPPVDTHAIELAAGGLVWLGDDSGARIAVVHRKKHGDWTLPKGRPEPGENMEAAALREAMEETGTRAAIRSLAGSYCYTKEGKPKVVLMWHMTHDPARYDKPAPLDEVDEVAWLSADEAIQRLTHPTEKQFVARHCAGVVHAAGPSPRSAQSKLDRLAAAIQTVRERFAATVARSTEHSRSWWADSARRSLEAAEAGLRRGDLDGGWGGVHDAERFLTFGMTDDELLARAASLNAETQGKLGGWRAVAITRLFGPVALADWLKPSSGLAPEQRVLLENVVVESLSVLHDHSNNTYHRMHLVGEQLQFLVAVCGFLLLAALGGSLVFAEPNSTFGVGRMASVILAGALGGVVSAMYQLSRVGQSKIPEALLHGLITSGRPLIGAASALFIYAVLHSNVISLIDASKVTFEAALVLGFVAGFSEQFVLSTVAKVTGEESTKQTTANHLSKAAPPGGGAAAPRPPGAPPAPGTGAGAAAVKVAPAVTGQPPATDKPAHGRD
jgi:8-oxo-dGTP pyrophosphatase MutT (NUDIX family)